MNNTLVLNLIAVFLGGGIGCTIRYLISLIKFGINFPCSTLIVNIIGSLVFGLIYALCLNRLTIPDAFRLFMIVGFCGGISTLSAMSFDNYSYLEQGLYWHFALNTLLNITVPLFAVLIGVYFGKQI